MISNASETTAYPAPPVLAADSLPKLGGDTTDKRPLDLSELIKIYGIRTHAQMQQERKQRREYLVEGVIPKASINLLVGDSGLGKSPLGYQLALCVAAGKPFLDFPVEQGTVLVLDYENGTGQTVEMLDRLAQHLTLAEVPPGLLLWNVNDSPPTFDLKGMIAAARPSLVIIDSLGSGFPEAETDAKNANRQLQTLRAITREVGCAFIALHHRSKEKRDPLSASPTLDKATDLRKWFQQARGSSALVNGSDVRLGVAEADNKQETLVLRGFERIHGELPKLYIERVPDGHGEPVGYRRLTGTELIFFLEHREAAERLPLGEFSFRDAERVYGKGGQPTVNFLKAAQDAGVVRKLSKGRYLRMAS